MKLRFSAEDQQTMREAGMDAFVGKPFTQQELAEAMRIAIDRRMGTDPE